MGVLTHDAIVREMEAGTIKVDPFSPDQVGPAWPHFESPKLAILVRKAALVLGEVAATGT